MVHVKDSLFQNFKFGAFTFLVFYSVIHSCRGESQVIGSSNPIVAQVGEGIILPCHLDPALNALDMTLEWVRPDLDPRFVFVWRDGVELKSKKHPSYQGRTSLFPDELQRGNISLKLSKVKISDEGKYRCFIPGLKKESYVQLVVGAVSSPVIHLSETTSGVVLQCESRGWHPEPEVLWLDGEGKLLSAGPPETVRGPDDLYTVSSRVTVEKRHSNNFTCRVQQKDINQTREAHINVPGESQVIGSSNPTVAQLGEGIILPCRLDPALNALDMTLEWVRPDLDPRFVFVWRDGVELKSKKHPSYQGRTSMFPDELEKGNISLKLSKVKISDEGKYRCFIPGLKKESYVQLVVGAVSSPVIHLNKTTSGVVLQCESSGWYPKPEVLWLDGEGKLLSAGPPETVRGPDDLYTVSSRVTVEKRHGNSFSCRVQQKDINQTRETHINVPDDFFPIPPGSSSSAPIVIGVVVGLMVILIAAVVFVVWKCRQNKIMNKKQNEDEESLNVTENKKMKKSDVINNSEQEILMQREKERSETTAETETEETGLLSQIDEITPQIELINVLNDTQANVENQPVNNGPELQSTLESKIQIEQALAGGDTNTVLKKSPEDTETAAVNEGGDALSTAEGKTEHDLNSDGEHSKSGSENIEQLVVGRQIGNNLQTVETRLQSQIDGEIPQKEKSIVLNVTQANVENQPVNNRPELRERQREQPTAGEETITGLVNCPEDSEAEAVDEGRDSLSQEEEKTEHDPNKREKETTAETETEETGLLSQIDEITLQIELINVLNETQANVEHQPVNNGPGLQSTLESKIQIDQALAGGDTNTVFEKSTEDTETAAVNEGGDALSNQPVNNRPELRERQREQPTAGGDTNTGLVKGQENTESEAVDEESAALNGEEGRTEDLNNGGAESKSGSDSTEQPGEESQTKNYMHTESEESPTNGKTEDPSSKEKEKLTGMLKIKEREEEKFEKNVSRFEGQVNDKEKQIHDLKLQLEEMETERKLQKDKMVPETQIVEADKKLLDIQKKLEKRETDLESMKKNLGNDRRKKIKASNEKEEIIKKLNEMGENEKSLTLSQDKAGNQSDSDDL